MSPLLFLLVNCSKNDKYDGRISGEWKIKSTHYAPFLDQNVITIKFDENNLELFTDGELTMEADLNYIDTEGSLLSFEIERKYINKENSYNLGYSEIMLAYKFGNNGPEIYLEDYCPIANCYRYNFIRN